eukprot:CAMPEP_0182921400 /NCGR_PEP_ID=MMETSP0105_2-20130417/4123_1 /TAXON_ID=81532 ORGANISM="Acanthoeca-like sp., Strain 10tr" /NCGR_SAMPLE_ID=MMETSP0105_2 /ASSEMBLY_ACC=CAM_ASM_000205 /LENGTH=167 /DNA_ID=CAMNT_0025058919 /DNA_START=313 /DNA_END=813 /DNA_ORIENTATION=-
MAAARNIPPANFGHVEEGLYRSGQPNELNFPFLEKLQLKAVLYLSPEDPSTEFGNFIADHELHFYHLEREKGAGPSMGSTVSEDIVVKALKHILSVENYPLLIACNLGRHHTGTVVGCLRKLQRWNLTSILEEYRRFAGGKLRLVNEQFIEFFDTELVMVPKKHPEW